jgi:hypothetical protein
MKIGTAPYFLTRKNRALSLFLLLLLTCPLNAFAEDKPVDEQVQTLMALPYLQGYYPAPSLTGVLRYDRQLTQNGTNLFTSCHSPHAALIDLKGNLLHQWEVDLEKIWPNIDILKPCFEMIHLYPNGDLLGVVEHHGLIKIDKDSNLLWDYKCNCHHDLDVAADGTIYALDQRKIMLNGKKSIAIDDLFLILSADGKLKKQVSLWNLFQKSKDPQIHAALLHIAGLVRNGQEDIFHANTIQLLTKPLKGKAGKIFKPKRILTSMLTLSSIAVIDLEKEELVWFQDPIIWHQGQHFPQMLDNGNILMFDNHYGGLDYSRVFEFEPLSQEVKWQYLDPSFYSNTHGTAQRLANGNTLITEGDQGRVLEVTPDKKVVWQFVNPHRTGDNNELIATIQILQRIDESQLGWLNP